MSLPQAATSSSSSLFSASPILSGSTPLETHTPGSTPATGSENGDAIPFTTDHVVSKLRDQLPRPAAADEFILVTGGLGYIGSHTALELMKEGYNVVLVDNLANCFASTRWRIQHLAAQHCEAQGQPTPQLRFHKLSYQNPAMRVVLEQYDSSSNLPENPDLMLDPNHVVDEDDDAPQPRSQITGVIHFAAYKSVSESIDNPLDYYDNNVCGLVSFIRLLGEFNIRNFIFSSSATVYGSKANAEKPLQEDDVMHHPTRSNVEGLTCTYARTKYFSEAILADVARSDHRWRIVALRYFNPVGCDPSGLLGETPRTQATNLFPVVAEVLAGKRPALSIFGQDWPTRDGTAIRDYIHVADIARGHVAALFTGSEKPFRTYNLGSGTGTSVLEIVDSLEAVAKRPVPVKWTGRRAGDVGFCVASTTRAEEELGWRPRETIAQSARDLWNYICKMQLKRMTLSSDEEKVRQDGSSSRGVIGDGVGGGDKILMKTGRDEKEMVAERVHVLLPVMGHQQEAEV
ncbi:hypothetical protein B0H66DRAFT_523431 [Apodospora peruviana]|uniref:NAD-dependent epimerase/dehydratase domain-containing protein n=1 Tax=Apodospora peruviana TaxID=516989 RepID=A0AAE0HXZ0_9PEZI|nr:hypothetical protein B0H66DRAFT_523431 [Apodospora peruviana]